MLIFLICLALALIYSAIMWTLSLIGHAMGLTPSWHQIQAYNWRWITTHYSHPVLGYFTTAGIVLGTITTVLYVIWKHLESTGQTNNGYYEAGVEFGKLVAAFRAKARSWVRT